MNELPAGESMTAIEAAPAGRWRMALLANMAQNVAYGLTFGLFGTLLVPVTAEFQVPSAIIAAGISVFGIVHGLLSPVVGSLASKWSVRGLMVTGALMLSLAFGLMSILDNAWGFMAVFGVIGGAAAACMGLTPVTILLGQWFKEDRGKIFGLAMIPWLPMVAPIVGALLIEDIGWRATVRVLAGMALVTAALLMFVHSPPSASQVEAGPSAASRRKAPGWLPRLGEFEPDKFYWVLALLTSVYSGATVVLLTFVPQYATTLGFSLSAGAMLVSIQGLCGMAGAPAFGALFDRLRGPTTLGILAGLLAGSCAIFASAASYIWLVIAAGFAGLVGGAVTPLLGAMLSERYPDGAVGPAMGLASLLMLPFISLLPMLAGILVDRTGQYVVLFGFEIVLMACAAAACLLLAVLNRSPISNHMKES